MKGLQMRVRRLESRVGTTAPLPWETPSWEQLSDAEMVDELEQYVAAAPDSALARQWRAIAALSDRELEEVLATLDAETCDAPREC